MKLFFLQEIDDLLAGGLSQEEEDDVLEELDQIIQVGTPEDKWEDPTCQGTSLTLKAPRELSGSVVECLTRDCGAAGSCLTGITVLWSLSKTHVS